jgi:hypothetical protein
MMMMMMIFNERPMISFRAREIYKKMLIFSNFPTVNLQALNYQPSDVFGKPGD